jgi:hypothetical protein
MSKPWHRNNPARFSKERSEVEAEYPELHFRIASEIVLVRGTFPVRFEGQVLDRYSVEVALGRDHPKSLPVVREVGGRIPWVADRHVNTNGTACVLLPDERWKVWPDGSTILEFLNGPLRNFFLGQGLVEQGKPWPFGQWGHGVNGIREYYGELLRTNDVQVIRGYLECVAAKKIKGHWPCPCGSGKRLRDCHVETVRDLQQKIARRDAVNSLEYLRGTPPDGASPR